MDHALLVRGFEALGDLLRDGERLVDGHRPALQPLREVLARHELQHQEARAAGLVDAVDRATFGWLSEASIFASRSKRAKRSASSAKARGSTLIATSRPSFVSFAR